jgi:hypothetical protein
MTIIEIILLEWRPFKLFNIPKLRLRAFARLWKARGEAMSTEMPGPSFDLLAKCKGVVLDIGPGSGEVLSRFNPDTITVGVLRMKSRRPKLTLPLHTKGTLRR